MREHERERESMRDTDWHLVLVSDTWHRMAYDLVERWYVAYIRNSSGWLQLAK